MHNYTILGDSFAYIYKKTAFLSFFCAAFWYKLNLLEEQIGKGNEKKGPLPEDKQLFACRRTAVRLPYGQLSVRSPTAVRLQSDSCRTGKHGFLNLHFLLISRF